MNKTLENNLMPNETVVAVAEFSKALFLPGAFITFLFLVAAPPAVFVGACSLIPAFLHKKFNILAITNKKIFGKVGIVKKQELESPLNKIQNIKIERTFWGRVFGYGTINITTDSGIYSFKYIRKTNEFKNKIMAQIEISEYDKMDIQAKKIAEAFDK